MGLDLKTTVGQVRDDLLDGETGRIHHLGIGGNFDWVGEGPGPGALASAGWALRLPQIQASGPAAWLRPAPNARGDVLAMVSSGDDMIAGGSFDLLDEQGGPDEDERRPLLRWHEGQIEGGTAPFLIDPVDHDHDDIPARVDALSSEGDRICAGGDFSDTAQGTAVSDLECRDLATQQDLYPGQGTDNTVRALEPFWQMQVNAP